MCQKIWKICMILFIGLLLASTASAQSVKAKQFRSFRINQLRNVNWELKAGEVDTSVIFLSNSVMSILGKAYDGVNGDSAHFKLHLDVKGVDGWINSRKTKTVTEDSTNFEWDLTATFLTARDSMRVRAEALGDCRVLDYIDIILEFKGTEPTWYY